MCVIMDQQAVAFDRYEKGSGERRRRADEKTACARNGIRSQPTEIDAFGVFAVCIPDIRAMVVFDPKRKTFIRIRIRRAGGPGGDMNVLARVRQDKGCQQRKGLDHSTQNTIYLSMYKTCSFFLFLLFCGAINSVWGQTGVPYALAHYRSTILTGIHYELAFHLPVEKEKPVQGEERLLFVLDKRVSGPLLLDFRAPAGALRWVRVNGRTIDPAIKDEHLAIPAALLHAGADTIETGFTAGNAALNRNGEFLYTLLVPDRARTLFPCFDQPDLKAVFTLMLTAPAGWKVMGNAPLLDSTSLGDSCRWVVEAG